MGNTRKQYVIYLSKESLDRATKMAKENYQTRKGFIEMCINKEWNRHQSEQQS